MPKTATTQARPEAIEAQAEPDAPAERLERAQEALAATHQRITDLDAHRAAMDERLATLNEQAEHVYDAANDLARELHALPAAIDAARARALVASETSRDSALRAVEHLRERFATLTQQEAKARTAADTTRHALAIERERIEAERGAAEAERADLAGLITHLHAEVAAARSAAGEALAQQLRAERNALEAARTAATAHLDQAQAALAAFEERARSALRAHPAALASAEGTDLLPRHMTQAERVVEAHVKVLDILDEGPFDPLHLQAGDVALGRVLCIPATPATAMALSGSVPGYWDARRRLAEEYLTNHRTRQNGAHGA
jgi:chromosome segregation ATPase